MGSMRPDDVRATESERQLAAAADRHREVVAAMKSVDRSAVSEEAAIRALGRGVQLVAFTLRRAAAAGVPFERLVAVSGWGDELGRATPGPGAHAPGGARVAPGGGDPHAGGPAAGGFEGTAPVGGGPRGGPARPRG